MSAELGSEHELGPKTPWTQTQTLAALFNPSTP